MFDNILHQPQVKELLSQDVKGAVVPPAILFWGPEMSGKLSAALELARVLSCTLDGDWTCSCDHCNAQRSLSHARTLIAGKRLNLPEIRACADVFLQDNSDGCRYLFLRSVHKLLRRLDPPLWEGEYARISRSQSVIERMAEAVNGIMPGRRLPTGKKMESQLENIVRDCEALSGLVPDLLPVWQVRNMISWARHSVRDDHKTIIIDSADRMSEGARNAFLKFLEEPPMNTTIILLAGRKTMLMPTILSRLRPYAFHNRLQNEQQDVLKKVFRVKNGEWSSLAEFFMAWDNADVMTHIHTAASDFIDKARLGGADYSEMIAGIAEECEMGVFLRVLTENLRERWLKEPLALGHKKWAADMEAVCNCHHCHENLNMNSVLVLRRLYSDLRVGT